MVIPDPLVLLPGMNCSERLWTGVTQHLDALVDRRAVHHGALVQDSIDACVAHLLGVLPGRFALAGLSLGGIVAMTLVHRAPERVSRLCLMSTNARRPTRSQLAHWAGQRAALATGHTARDLQRDLLPVLLHAPNRTPSRDEEVLRMADETGIETLDRQLAAQATRVDQRRRLSEVRVPTLVLAAAADALCPLRKQEEIDARIPRSRLVVLEGVGHLSSMEAPELVAHALASWLA